MGIQKYLYVIRCVLLLTKLVHLNGQDERKGKNLKTKDSYGKSN